MLDGASSESESKISNTIGIRTSKYKYFRDRFDDSKNIHLFDIENDPLEEINIFENNQTIVNSMELELQKQVAGQYWDLVWTHRIGVNVIDPNTYIIVSSVNS